MRSVCWSGDGSNRICSGSDDKTVRVWDAESGQCLTVLEGHTANVRSVCWSGDGSNRICSGSSGSSDQTVRVWDAESGQCTNTFQNSDDKIPDCFEGLVLLDVALGDCKGDDDDDAVRYSIDGSTAPTATVFHNNKEGKANNACIQVGSTGQLHFLTLRK